MVARRRRRLQPTHKLTRQCTQRPCPHTHVRKHNAAVVTISLSGSRARHSSRSASQRLVRLESAAAPAAGPAAPPPDFFCRFGAGVSAAEACTGPLCGEYVEHARPLAVGQQGPRGAARGIPRVARGCRGAPRSTTIRGAVLAGGRAVAYAQAVRRSRRPPGLFSRPKCLLPIGNTGTHTTQTALEGYGQAGRLCGQRGAGSGCDRRMRGSRSGRAARACTFARPATPTPAMQPGPHYAAEPACLQARSRARTHARGHAPSHDPGAREHKIMGINGHMPLSAPAASAAAGAYSLCT